MTKIPLGKYGFIDDGIIEYVFIPELACTQ